MTSMKLSSPTPNTRTNVALATSVVVDQSARLVRVQTGESVVVAGFTTATVGAAFAFDDVTASSSPVGCIINAVGTLSAHTQT